MGKANKRRGDRSNTVYKRPHQNRYSEDQLKLKSVVTETVNNEVATVSSSESDIDEPPVYQQLLSSVTSSSAIETIDSSEDEESFDGSDEDIQLSDSSIDIASEINDNTDDEQDTDMQPAVEDVMEELSSSDDEVSDNDPLEDHEVEDSDGSGKEESQTEDFFKSHFERVLEDEAVEKIESSTCWTKGQIKIPYFGKCLHFETAVRGAAIKEIDIKKLCVKKSLKNQIAITNKKFTKSEVPDRNLLTKFQSCLFAVFNSYKDFYYSDRTFKNGEDIRLAYCIHALNHVLKTRSRVVTHNNKLKGKTQTDLIEYRDQGLTRPKVLIVLPYREAAKRVVSMLQLLLLPEEQSYVTHKKRFYDEYSLTEPEEKKGLKPADFEEQFSGNVDDHFRIGIGVSRNCLKLYSDFYSSDIILASPLGLRTLIGSDGDKKREFDFLSSIEVLILDQADVFLMQNWDHILHLLDHMHLQPKESHGVDFSRVRMWTLNGWSKYYRQTLIFSDIVRPEVSAVFNKHCHNWAGKITIPKSFSQGSICQIVTQLPQVFKRFEVSLVSEVSEKRFEFFKSQLLSDLKDKTITGKLVYVSSYFDFVRLRNFLKKEEIDFMQINEYSKPKDIDRARGLFFHQKVALMLYTERFHFFRRIRVRGVRNLIFYDLPNYPHFYSEVCNMLKDPKVEPQSSNFSCTVLYNRFDGQRLAGIVGTERAGHMVTTDKTVHMLVTGET